MLMLIISVIKKIPTKETLAIARCVYLIPGAISAAFLASSGVNITLSTVAQTVKDLNSSEVWTQTTNTNQIVLVSPEWITVHWLIFIVIAFYTITSLLRLLGIVSGDEKEQDHVE